MRPSYLCIGSSSTLKDHFYFETRPKIYFWKLTLPQIDLSNMYFELRLPNIWHLAINWSIAGQSGHHFAEDIYRCISLNKEAWVSIIIPLKFVP